LSSFVFGEVNADQVIWICKTGDSEDLVDAPNSRKIKFDLGSEFGRINIRQDNMTRWHANINDMARNAIIYFLSRQEIREKGAPFLSKWAITKEKFS